MSEQTIFNGEADQAPPAVVPQTPTSTIPPELAELVGEGKKYATVEKALAAVPHQYKHISKLEEELATLRSDLEKRRTTQELLDELKSGIPQGETTPTDGLNQDTVVQLVEKVISQKEKQQAASLNTGKVVFTFRELFGDKAEVQYNKVAQDAGLSVQELNRLAATSPAAVLRLAGIDKPSTPNVPGKIRSDVNPNAIGGQPNTDLSAKVQGSSTRDVVDAWRKAGEKVKKSLENT